MRSVLTIPNSSVISKRTLADRAARLKSSLVVALSSRDGFDLMRQQYDDSKNGWLASTYDDYVLGTEVIFEVMKCVAATKDAVRLLDHAAKSLPNDMDIFNMRPEVPSGFLYLAQPLMSGSNEVVAYVWVTLPDTMKGVKSVLAIGTFTADLRFGMMNWEIRPNRTFLNIQKDLQDAPTPESREDAITDLRLVIAFNLLLAQGVTDTEEMLPTRQIRRQYQRQGIHIDPVVLVQLPTRHSHSNGSGGAAIDWSHRWIVSGHWRKQWYPTAEVHRPKWIIPYVKGPDDKPLVVKEKRYVFDPQHGIE